jgi:hypothetical protein
MKKRKKKYIPEAIKISASFSFILKSRCKYCGSHPVEYYRTGNGWLFEDIKDFLSRFRWVQQSDKRMCDDFYLYDDPKDFKTVTLFSYNVDFCHYNPTLHHKRGVPKTRDYNEFLACECGKTSWVFKQRSVKNRPEISNRQARVKYDKKIRILI